ncbi:MAG: 3-keto-5-aminohexanoate cleavage protein, partial [Pseudomonadota bacterium]
MVAPNGARHGRADHPAIPVSIAETVAVAHACQGAGARGLHLHVRDADGRHSLDAGHYSEALSELARAVPD